MERQLQDLLFLRKAIENEIAMAKLYEVLITRAPYSAKLWISLHEEELAHAAKFKQILNEVKNGNMTLDHNRHNVKQLVISIDDINSKTKTWKRWGVKRSDVFDYIMKLEDSVVERTMFTPKEHDSEEIKIILLEINQDSNDHFFRITQERLLKDPSVGFFKYIIANIKYIFKKFF